MLNGMAAGLLVLARLGHDRRGPKLNLEITCQTLSAVQPEASYRCDGLENGTKLQNQALGGDSPTARLGVHAPL